MKIALDLKCCRELGTRMAVLGWTRAGVVEFMKLHGRTGLSLRRVFRAYYTQLRRG